MTGGLFQLVVLGIEDIFIVGDPQISMFATVYRRYSNFSLEDIDIPVQGKQQFGDEVRIKIPKRGDILGQIYFNITLPEIMMQYNKPLFEIVNDVFRPYGIQEYTSTDVITVEDAQKRIDIRITELQNQTIFYRQLIQVLEMSHDLPTDLDLFNRIINVSVPFLSKTDLGYFYIYTAVVNSSQQKVEPDGTFDLTSPPDLTNYHVLIKKLVSNLSRGHTHVIMTLNEIVKGLYSYVLEVLFGDDPAELRFIQNVFSTIPNSTSFVGTTVQSFLVNVFDTFFNIQTGISDTSSELERIFQNNTTTVSDLLNTPFYIRFDSTLVPQNTQILFDFKNLDNHKYMKYYMNLRGPTVQDLLTSLSIPGTDITAIRQGLTILYNDYKVLMTYDIIKNFLLSTYVFISLDNNNGNLILIKRMDNPTTGAQGDILEYSDFFYGPNITPSIPLASTLSTPTWVNPNLVPDPYWFRMIGLDFRQTLQNPTIYIPPDIAWLVNQGLPFPPQFNMYIVFDSFAPQFVLYPQIANLTIASNQSAGFIDTTYLNNYNLFLDSVASKLQKDQHLAMLEVEDFTIDQSFQDPVYSPLSLTTICGEDTIDPNLDPFNPTAVGNNFLQNNYYKTFVVGPDVDPRMFRIRYMNGALAIIFRYLKNKINGIINDNILNFTPTELTLITTSMTNAAHQLSDILVNYLFPRIDPMLPYSTTNDRTYILLTTILNSIPTGNAGFSDQTTLNTDVTNTLISQGATLTTLDTYFLYNIYYLPLTAPISVFQFITLNIFWKDQRLIGETIFDVYIENLQKLLIDFGSTFSIFTIDFLNTLIQNILQLKDRFSATCCNQLALYTPDINEIFDGSFNNLTVILDPSQFVIPVNMAVHLYRPALSDELGFTEPWDLDTEQQPAEIDIPPPPVPNTPVYTDLTTEIDY
jgi:hypothetical protein